MPPGLPPFAPFPLAMRVGTDICSIPRILGLLKGRYGQKFVRKVLRREEREESGVEGVVERWAVARGRLDVKGERREGVVRSVAVGEGKMGGWKAGAWRRVGLEGRNLGKGEEGIEDGDRDGKEEVFKDVLWLKRKARQEWKPEKFREIIRDENRRAAADSERKQIASGCTDNIEQLAMMSPKNAADKVSPLEGRAKSERKDSWIESARRMFGAKNASKESDVEEEKGNEEKDIQKERDDGVAGVEVVENRCEIGMLKNKPDPTRDAKGEEERKEIQLFRAEVESRQAWMMSRNYDYEGGTERQRRDWQLVRRRELDEKETEQWNEEEKSIPPEKKADWLRVKRRQRQERHRMQKKVSRSVMTRKKSEMESEDIDPFWEGMKGGVMDGQGMMDGVWVPDQQSSSENNLHIPTTTSDPVPVPANDLTTPESAPCSTPRLADRIRSQDRQRIEREKIAAEGRTSTTDVQSTTQNSIESVTNPKPMLADLFTNLIEEEQKVEQQKIAAKQEARERAPITYVSTTRTLATERVRLESAFVRKRAGLTALMKEMGITMSPKEVAILASEARPRVLKEKEQVGWWSLPLEGRQDVGRDVQQDQSREVPLKEREEGQQVEKEPPRQDNDILAVLARDNAAEKIEREMRENNLEELERELRDAEAALQKAAQFLAGRFAAKEATMKAHLSRRLTYHSILILKPERKPGETGSLAPVAVVMPDGDTTAMNPAGKHKGVRGEGKNGDGGEDEGGRVLGKEVRISISHDGDFATAVCLAVDE